MLANLQQNRKFLVIVWVIFCILYSCRSENLEKIESDKESGSQIAIRNFVRTKYKPDGSREWKLVAAESYVFPDEDRTVFYNLNFLQYDKGKLSSELKSDWGEINHTTKKLELKGNIFLTTPDRKYLKTDSLSYDLDTEELVTDEDVAIYSSGTFIQGKGLRAKRDLGEFTILRPSAVTRGGRNPFQKD